jgi:uncharacterized protein YjgD (DUF1641 family)
MQKKNKKILLLESIINSDFLFLDQDNKKNLRYAKSIINLNKFRSTSLNPFETLKSIKQLTRSLQYLSKQNNKVLHILVENKQYLSVINSFLSKKDSKVSFLVKDFLVKEEISRLSSQSLLLLNTVVKNDKKLLKRLFDNNIFLINKINSKMEANNFGAYKVYNDLINFKKLIFLLVIIDLVLNENNN